MTIHRAAEGYKTGRAKETKAYRWRRYRRHKQQGGAHKPATGGSRPVVAATGNSTSASSRRPCKGARFYARGSSVRSSALRPLDSVGGGPKAGEEVRIDGRRWMKTGGRRAREIAATFRGGGSSERGRKGGRKGARGRKGAQSRRARELDASARHLSRGGGWSSGSGTDQARNRWFLPMRFWSFLSSLLLASTPFLDEETVSLFSPLSLLLLQYHISKILMREPN